MACSSWHTCLAEQLQKSCFEVRASATLLCNPLSEAVADTQDRVPFLEHEATFTCDNIVHKLHWACDHEEQVLAVFVISCILVLFPLLACCVCCALCCVMRHDRIARAAGNTPLL